jgi:hypothetical protein
MKIYKQNESLYDYMMELPSHSLFHVPNKDTYPPFKNGMYMEEYFLHFMKQHSLVKNHQDRTYIPLLWTNFQIESWFENADIRQQLQQSLDQYIREHPSTSGYFTVVQYDDGPRLTLPENTIVYGACSGDIILPLIYEDRERKLYNPTKQTFQEKSILCSFVGTNTHSMRHQLYNTYHGNSHFRFHVRDYWSASVEENTQKLFIETTCQSKFVLAPRGYGRSSFRFFEIFTLGSIPIYIWDDIEWLPYKELIDYSKICISIRCDQINDLENILLSIDETKYNEMIAAYENIKHMFQLDFMCHYISGYNKTNYETPGIIALSSCFSGLGNKLFHSAAGIAASIKHQCPLYITTKKQLNHHGHPTDHFETILKKVGIHLNEQWKNGLISSFFPDGNIKYMDGGYYEFMMSTEEYSNENIPIPCVMNQYYQYYPPLKPYEKEIRNLIRQGLDTSILPTIDPSSIFLHIRRGDYKNYDRHPILSMDYYDTCIDFFPTDKTVYVFSDEIEWVKENLSDKIKNRNPIVYVENENEIYSLTWMTQCRGGAICANSTFSWWGAFLGAYEERSPVYVPKIWMYECRIDSLFPEEWIVI